MYVLAAAMCLAFPRQGTIPIPDLKISMQVRATLASQVLKSLAEQTKLKFETTPQTENEVLLISATDVPLSDLMAQIATATTADWKQIDGGFRLSANNSARQQEGNREAQERAKTFQKMIAKRLDQLKKQEEAMAKITKTGKSSKADEQAIAMGMGMGMGGGSTDATVTKLLQGINPSVLATVEAGDRLVFSTNPTSMQRSLGSNAISLINSLIVEHNKTISSRQVASDEAMRDPEMDKLPDFMKSRMNKGNKKIGAVQKALLTFSKNSLIDFLSAELTLYDDQGKVAYEAQAMLGGQFMDAMEQSIGADGKPKPKPVQTTKGTPVEYSADSKEMASQSRMTDMMGGQKLSKEILAKISQPAVYDPLSFAITDEMFAVAKLQHKPLVANLTDDLLSLTNMMGFADGELPNMNNGEKATLTAEKVWEKLKAGKTMQVLKEDSWLVLKPAKPFQNRKYRVDRKALQTLVLSSRAKGAPSLDDLAAFAQKVESPNESGLAQLYLALYIPGSLTQSMAGLTDWDLVRFYGSLDFGMRTMLANGGRMTLGAMTQSQANSLTKIVYGKKGALDVLRPGQKPKEKMPSFMSFMGSDTIDYLDEPTEAMPVGIPRDGWVELKLNRDPIMAPQPVDDKLLSPMLGVLGPDELSMFRMLKEDKNMQQFAGQLPTFDKMKLGERTVLTFKFQFTQALSHSGSLNDNQFPNGGRIVSMGALPDDLQKKLDDHYNIFKKSPLGAMMGMAGGMGRQQAPPP